MSTFSKQAHQMRVRGWKRRYERRCETGIEENCKTLEIIGLPDVTNIYLRLMSET